MLLEGQQFDQYRFLQVLGSGGMGEVYLAEDVQLRRKVAIKVIWTDTNLDVEDDAVSEAARLFLREARLIAQLEHIHILPLYASGETSINGRAMMYMVMPYRPEGSLAEWLSKHGGNEILSLWDVGRIVQQAAGALQYAHNHRIIHQDVKPANFLIHGHADHPDQLDLQLADFGVARLAIAPTQSQVIRGTPIYMAPEQWEGLPVPATDQYALAVMIYELLTGHPPFISNNQQQLWYMHHHIAPPSPSASNADISETLDAVLLHALHKRPRERFRSVTAFSDAFQEALFNVKWTDEAASLPLVAEEVPETVVSERKPRYSPGKMLLFLAMVVLIVAGSFLYLSRINLVTSGTTALHPARSQPAGTAPTQTGAIGTANASLTATALATAATVNAQGTVNAQATGTTVAGIATANAQATATASVVAATATAYATAVTSGSLLLRDPLQDNGLGHQWDSGPLFGGGGCTFTQAAYHVSMPQNGYLAPCFARATNFANFSCQVQMTILHGDQGGLILRANAGSGSFYYFHISTNGRYALEKYASFTSIQVLGHGTSSAIKTGEGQPNFIAIVAYGSNFDLYVNGQYIITLGDSSYSQGQIGVAAQDITNSTEVVFSNMQVWSR